MKTWYSLPSQQSKRLLKPSPCCIAKKEITTRWMRKLKNIGLKCLCCCCIKNSLTHVFYISCTNSVILHETCKCVRLSWDFIPTTIQCPFSLLERAKPYRMKIFHLVKDSDVKKMLFCTTHAVIILYCIVVQWWWKHVS